MVRPFFPNGISPRKFNIEPKNDGFQARNLLFQSGIFRFHVKLWEGIFCAIQFSFLFSLLCFLFCVSDSIISYHRPFKSRHIGSYHFMSNHITSQRNIYIYTYIRVYICKKKLLHVIKRTMLKSLFKTVRSVISTDHQLRLFHDFGAPKNKKKYAPL